MSAETKASASIAAQQHGGVDGFAVVADTAGLLRRAVRQAPAGPARPCAQPSMKICAPICSATVWPLVAIGTGPRSGDPMLEVQPGGVFGRIAVAAPPQDRALLDDVVEPGLADLLGREVCRGAVVLERAHESEGAGDVVVGDDQRLVQPVVHVIFDRPELLHDLLVGPALERPAEIDAHQLAEHAGIDALEIIVQGRA